MEDITLADYFDNEDYWSDIKLFKEIVKHEDLEARDDLDRTPLIICANNGLKKQVRILLDAGADVNAQTNNGNTALFRAVIKKERDIIISLLSAGAEDLMNNKGVKPSDKAKDKKLALLIKNFRKVGRFGRLL